MPVRPRTSILTIVLSTVSVSCLVGCAGRSEPPSSGEPPITTAKEPAETARIELTDVADLAPRHPDEIVPGLAKFSRAAADELLARTGVAELLPGAGPALAALGAARPLETSALNGQLGPIGFRSPGTTGSPTRLSTTPPAPLSSHGAALGLSTLGSALNSAMRHGADGDAVNADGVVDYGPAGDDTPTSQIRMVDGATELRIVQRATEHVDGGELSVEMDLRGKLDACPTAGGDVAARLSVDVRISAVAGTQTAGGRYMMDLDLSATVDDTAALAGFVVDVTGSASDTAAASSGAGRTGWFVEGGSRTTLAGRPGGDLTVTEVDGALTRRSTGADDASARSFLLHQSSTAMYLAAMVLVGAEEFWRGGACVDVQLLPIGDPGAVEPGDQLVVGIEATSVADGQPITAPATAAASATGGTVSPSGAAQQLPASVTYSVPADGADGELAGEVTSRRGIGTVQLPISAATALVVDAKLDVFRASGTKCGGVAGPWELMLTADFGGYPFNGVLRFELDSSTWQGQYTLTGSTTGGGITVDQSGSGTVKAVAGPNGVQLVLSGTAWTGGPTQAGSVDANRTVAANC